MTLGTAIPLFYNDGRQIPKILIYSSIEDKVLSKAEEYKNAEIQGVFLRVYFKPKETKPPVDLPLLNDDLLKKIIDVYSIKDKDTDPESCTIPEAKSLYEKQPRTPRKITTLKTSKEACKAFIVADIETILVEEPKDENVEVSKDEYDHALEFNHKAYAAGYLVVNPAEDKLCSKQNSSLKTFFSEDHHIYDNFKDRSEKMFYDFINSIEFTVKKLKDLKIRTIYFHNLSRFDGIFIIRYYTNKGSDYKVKPLIRNHSIY